VNRLDMIRETLYGPLARRADPLAPKRIPVCRCMRYVQGLLQPRYENLTPALFLFAGEVKPGSSLSFCPVAGLTALPSVVLTRFFAGLDKPGRDDV